MESNLQNCTYDPDIVVKREATSVRSSAISQSSSVLLARKRAQAEAARVKLKFAETEALIKKQQAIIEETRKLNIAKAERQNSELEADLKLLSQQSEAAAAAAEVEALEYVDVRCSVLDIPVCDKKKLVEQYVEKHSSHSSVHVKEERHSYVQDCNEISSLCSDTPRVSRQFVPISTLSPTVPDPCAALDSVSRDSVPAGMPLNPQAKAFSAKAHTSTPATSDLKDNIMANELTRFLMKKDLLLSRFTVFNDQPESFPVWKSSFTHIVQDLGVNPREELDLLLKWLGPESSKHAHSIRIANASDPSKALQKVWERLDDRYGGPELIECALKQKLTNFPKVTNKDTDKMYALSDLLSGIASIKENPSYSSLLAYFDSSSGVNQVVAKLPYNLQMKWMDRASKYKTSQKVSFPPFTFFVDYVKEMTKMMNDPSFQQTLQPTPKREETFRATPLRQPIRVKKTDVSSESICPIHKTSHSLNQCKTFRAKPIQVRRKFLSDHKLCYGCCDSDKHVKRDCQERTKCDDCGSKDHPSALHVTSKYSREKHQEENGSSILASPQHGGEENNSRGTQRVVRTRCTEICENSSFPGKSCAKVLLVRVYSSSHPDKSVLTYALLDDQSNRSLATTYLLDLLDVNSEEVEYSLASCAGSFVFSGRVAEDCVVESLDRSVKLNLPPLIECNNIPDVREEIPTPEIASHYTHLMDIQEFIPPLSEARTLLLIGRDLPGAHHVLDQRVGSGNEPFAQRLRLGWIIVGETCLGKVHRNRISVNKTFVLDNGRPTVFRPCENRIHVSEKWDSIGSSVFSRNKDDNKVGLSIEDKQFIRVMEKSLHKDTEGNWVAPLPFRENHPPLPNNRLQTLNRAKNLHVSLSKDPVKLQHMVTFMQRVFESKHAEVAPPLTSNEECWYLPIFGVYHPQKPGQIRAVFDSSAQFQGLSLNSILLSGPDLTNNLLDVLLRFRMEPVAISGDIQQMFHSFLVEETHRNYLRFFWYEDNNPSNSLIEYRMKVHVFGNRPSPAIANYGLHRTAEISLEKYGSDVRDFIQRNFYVDDGLISLPTSTEAIDLMTRTMSALKNEGNLRLHKIASNKEEVMSAFASDDLAKDLKDLDIGNDQLPVQRSLGLNWDLMSDTFTFRVTGAEKPYTRRGILSVINSLYDPLGLVAPVTIRGKMILRKIVTDGSDWDSPLPEQYRSEWESWKTELQCLQDINIRRTYMKHDASLSKAVRREIHVYSDASEDAIAAVAYLKTISQEGEIHIGIILGKAKVAPKHGNSIPRLELCGALLAVDIYDIAVNALDIAVDCVQFHIDSKVVLGYINNRVRRFYMYVSNRIERILRTTTPEQWTYVPTRMNPADCATRSLPASQMQNSPWLQGPVQLYKKGQNEVKLDNSTFSLVDPENDKEIKPTLAVHVMKSSIEDQCIFGTHRFNKFSSWTALVRAFAFLRNRVCAFKQRNVGNSSHACVDYKAVETFWSVEQWIIGTVQREAFPEEYSCLLDKKTLPRNSSLLTLDPFLNQHGLICVGGRLRDSDLGKHEKFPVILPRMHHISTLLVRHYHEQVKHQGRFFTESMIRSAGIWIVGVKRLISSVIHACVKCRRLRGKLETQKMADLPVDRVSPAPPFSYTGVDVFGPWSVVTRRTRGGQASSKRWGVIFTCLSLRAIHIEVVEELSSSSFINALRRFIAIRGQVKELRSDRGTNFVGCTKDLQIEAINVEDAEMKKFLFDKGTVWRFNPPHSSHMGGVWERMIKTTRNILDSMLSEVSDKNLTHEVLTTFMCEVCTIVNARPIVAITSDPTNPFLLSPSTLLTQRTSADVHPFVDLNPKDMYKEQWRRVQYLAERFWNRWKQEYLQTLQTRRKWQCDKTNLRHGDIVLLKEPDSHRNNWPLGMVENAICGKDGRVRKAEVRITKNGVSKTYTRPVTELVLLLSDKGNDLNTSSSEKE